MQMFQDLPWWWYAAWSAPVAAFILGAILSLKAWRGGSQSRR